MTVLKVSGLKVRYSAKGPEILKGIDFEVKSDDFFAIIGPSGAGKSTLIRAVNRLVEPTSGEIILLDHNVTELNAKQLRKLPDPSKAFAATTPQEIHDAFEALLEELEGDLRVSS